MTRAARITDQRLLVCHQQAERRARRSAKPSRFLEYYERTLTAARVDQQAVEERLISYDDPIQLAAEIEGLAAWRRATA